MRRRGALARRATGWVACAAAAGLLGCPTAGNESPGIVLGTGEVEFEAVEDGDTLQIVQGPQSGYHVLGSLLVKGMVPGDPRDLSSPDNPTMTFDVLHEGSSVILLQPFTQGLDEAPSGRAPYTHQEVGRFVTLDIAGTDELDGETVTITARIDDAEGASASDEVTVELEPHPFNE